MTVHEQPGLDEVSYGNEIARLTYLDWQELYKEEKPFHILASGLNDSTPDFRETNLVWEESHEDVVENIRGREQQFTLDNNGFQVFKHTTGVTNFDSTETVEKIYLPEVEALIRKEVDGVDKILIFDWRIRKNDTSSVVGKAVDINNRMNHLLPSRQLHIDQSPAAILKRIRRQLPNEADFLLQGRVRVINAWRPLYNVVEDWPLLLCDGTSTDQKYLIPTDHIRRHNTAEVLYSVYNPNHKFYYLAKQDKDEVLLFKNFDSDESVKARWCPHASFQHQYIRPSAPVRQSIEIRALVFTYPA